MAQLISFEEAWGATTPEQMQGLAPLPQRKLISFEEAWGSQGGFTLPPGWSLEPPRGRPPTGVTVAPKGGVPPATAAFGDVATPSTIGRRLRQFGYGTAEGLAGIAGTAGLIDESARGLAGWLLNQIGAREAAKALGKAASVAPSAEAVAGVIEKAVGGFEPPRDVADEYLRTAGQFAPAVVGGRGGIIRRGAQALIPAVASETAGQAARQFAPQYEPAARLGAAIAASPVGARAGVKKPPAFEPATAAKLRAEAKMAFMEAEQQGLKIDGQRFRAMVADLERRMASEGLDSALHQKASAALRRLSTEAEAFAPKPPPAMAALTGAKGAQGKAGLPLTEAQTLRRVLSAAARSPDKDERRLASIMIERLDDLVDSFGGQKWAKARALYHKFSKAQQIEDMLENAGIRSGQFSVSGMENAIRTEFRQLYRKIVKDGRERARWTPEQRKLIKKLGNMRGAVNILRTIGKLSPRSQLMLAGGVAGGGVSFGSGDPTAAGTAGLAWGVGTAAQLAALGLTKRKVNQLRANVTGSAPPPSIPGAYGLSQNPLAAILAGYSGSLPMREVQR